MAQVPGLAASFSASKPSVVRAASGEKLLDLFPAGLGPSSVSTVRFFFFFVSTRGHEGQASQSTRLSNMREAEYPAERDRGVRLASSRRSPPVAPHLRLVLVGFTCAAVSLGPPVAALATFPSLTGAPKVVAGR